QPLARFPKDSRPLISTLTPTLNLTLNLNLNRLHLIGEFMRIPTQKILLSVALLPLPGGTEKLNAQTTPPKPTTNPPPVRVFIIAGQSNAEGHNHTNQYHAGREPFPAE